MKSEPPAPARAKPQPAPRGGPLVQTLRRWFVQMSFRTKFIVVGMLVAGPLSTLAGYAAAQFHGQVLQAQERAQALEQAARARDLVEALALHRGLTASVLAGGEGLSSTLVQHQQRVEELLQRLLTTLPANTATTDLPPAQPLATEVRALMALPDAKQPLNNFERHNRVIDELLVLMQRTGSRGASINGPQLAGAFDLAFVALPMLVESTGRQRGWGSAVLQLAQFSEAETARHLMAAGAVAMRLQLLEADPRVLAGLDPVTEPPGGAPGSVDSRLKAALAEVEVFSQRSIAQVLTRQGGSDSARQHFAEGTFAIDQLLVVARELTTRLQARTEAQRARAEWLRLVSLLALACLALMLLATYREFASTTVQRLQRLKQASRRIADGEFGDTVSVEGSDEIAALADAMDTMRRRLRQAVADSAGALAAQESERARTEFLARWSHDLRTPLSAVMGFARLMAERDQGQLSASQQQDLHRIQTAATHLLALVDDVLALSSEGLREIALQLQPVDLAEVARDAVAINGPDAEGRGIHVHLELPPLPPVLADRTRLLQVLGNLLGNAVKFNHDGGWVRLVGAADGQGLRIDVVDSGPGISEQHLPQLFKPFERLDAEQRGVPGTGLGLATCKRLVEAMHGQIGVRSQPGAGSTFTVWLPRAPESARSSTAPAPEPRLARARLAYVEDDETNAELLQAMLTARGLPAATVFVDAASALAVDTEFDLWIIDGRLPDGDGITLLQALRQRRGHALRAVMFTADAQPQRQAQALSAGFIECWTKPLAPGALEASLRRVLEG